MFWACPCKETAGSGFPLQSFCKKDRQKGFSLQSFTQLFFQWIYFTIERFASERDANENPFIMRA
jgi:hypothetical protein